MLSRQEVIKIAKLARLELSDEEVNKFQKQLSEILDYVGQLDKIDTSNIEPTSHATVDLYNRFQENLDESQVLKTQDALRNAPIKDDKYFKTNAVL